MSIAKNNCCGDFKALLIAEVEGGAEDNILLTENDPLFQTQRLNINSYKFDVPYGVYDVTFYFSDLLTCSVFAHTLSKIRTMSRNLYYAALWPLKTLTNYCN